MKCPMAMFWPLGLLLLISFGGIKQ
jgi:hypothetical protein